MGFIDEHLKKVKIAHIDKGLKYDGRITIDHCKNVDCDKEPFKVEVVNVNYLFCCQKGFGNSVEEFNKLLKSMK